MWVLLNIRQIIYFGQRDFCLHVIPKLTQQLTPPRIFFRCELSQKSRNSPGVLVKLFSKVMHCSNKKLYLIEKHKICHQNFYKVRIFKQNNSNQFAVNSISTQNQPTLCSLTSRFLSDLLGEHKLLTDLDPVKVNNFLKNHSDAIFNYYYHPDLPD